MRKLSKASFSPASENADAGKWAAPKLERPEGIAALNNQNRAAGFFEINAASQRDYGCVGLDRLEELPPGWSSLMT